MYTVKHQYVNTSTFFKYFAAIAMSLLFAQAGVAQSTENQQMVFEGSLTDASGNSISLAGAALNFYVTANGCYLYGESSTSSGDSQGNIIHRFGGGTVLTGSPNSFSQNLFFGNVSGTTTFAGNNCFVSASDTRLAQVYYPTENITATIKLGTVPYAQNATTFSGKNVSDFVLASVDTYTLFSSGSAGQFLTKTASGLAWTNTSLTASAVTSTLGYTPANSATLSAFAQKANNLSDLPSSSTARANLGLGSLATKSFVLLASEVSGTLPASNLPSFSGDIATSAGTSVASVQALRGVALAATAPVSGQVLYFNGFSWTPITIPSSLGTVTNVTSTNSDIVVTSSSTTPNLTLNVGTGANQIIRLDSSAKLPAVDASQLTALNASQLTSGTIDTNRLPAFTGDASTAVGSNTITVGKLRGISISASAPTTSQVLTFNGTAWSPATPVTDISSLNGSTSQTQTFATGTTGLTPSILTSNGVHTFNIPLASGASVTAGLVSNADYTTFVNKITSSAVSIAQVLGYVPASATSLSNLLVKTNNLSELTSSSTARTNLGLGSLATANSLDLGSASATGTLANARLPAFTGDASTAVGSNTITVGKLRGISISASAPTTSQVLSFDGIQWSPTTVAAVAAVTSVNAGTGLLGGPITSSGSLSVNFGASAGTVAQGNDSRIVQALQSINNLSDITSASTARTNLGLGSLATANSLDLGSASATGTLANARLPAFTGDASTAVGSNTITVGKLRGISISASAPTTLQVLSFDGIQWSPTTPVTDISSLNGSTSATQSFASALTGSQPTYVTVNGVHTLNIPYASTPAVTAGLISYLDYSNFSNKITSSAASIVQVLGYVPVSATSLSNLLVKTNNLSELTSSSTARTNLGLGSLATANSLDLGSASATGTLANARLPAFVGDAATAAGSNTITVSKLRGINISSATPTAAQVLAYDGSQWAPATLGGGGSVTNINAGTGLLGGPITTSGTLSINFGVSTGTVAAGNDARIVQALQSINNLADIASASTARTNLGLGNLSTKSTVDLANDVSGVLSIANGGSVWITSSTGIYNSTNSVAIGSASVIANTKFYVESNGGYASRISNVSATGYGLKIDVAGTNGTQYALNVNNASGTMFMVQNDGKVGVGTLTPTARFHVAAGSASMAPLKLTSGTLLTTPTSGSIEYDGANLYITDATNTRRTIATGGLNSIDNASFINSTGNMTLNPLGSVIVSSTVASTNSSTGALVVNGGLGVAGNIFTSGTIITTNNITAQVMTASAGVFSALVAGSNLSGGSLQLESTTHATKGNILLNTTGGNVGIGVASTPVATFQVTNSTSSPTAYFKSTSGIGTNLGLAISAGTNASDYALGVSNASGTSLFFIRGNGNVGVGTSSPGSLFEVSNATSGSPSTFAITKSSPNMYETNVIAMQRSGGTQAAPTSTANGDQLGMIRFAGYGSSAYRQAAAIESFATAAGGTFVPGNLVFSTAPNSGNTVERMRIDSSGNVGIGNINPTSTLTVGPGGAVAANYNIFASAYNSAAGQAQFAGNWGSSNYWGIGPATQNSDNTIRIGITADSTGTWTAAQDINVVVGGRIGIGVSAPTARLQLASGTTTLAAFKFTSGTLLATPSSGAIEYDGSRMYITDGANIRRTFPTGTTSSTIDNISSINSPGDLNLNTTSSTAVFITSNLVIGSASAPLSKFNLITNTAGSELARFDGGATGYFLRFAANSVPIAHMGALNGATLFNNELGANGMGLQAVNYLQLGVATTAVMTITSATRVGIGTNAPTTALTVSGSVRTISGGYEFADGTSQTTSAFGGYERVSVNCGSASTCTATCSAGKQVIGGGCSNAGSSALISSYPSSNTQYQCGWATGSLITVTAFAVCTKM
ncbi:hypothetical protein CIK05_13170 [Bdellovibrio sp. qaytius]|nr:hypothetical protein CIK05_13170 [Bdellovibrio sp. qaytius]